MPLAEILVQKLSLLQEMLSASVEIKNLLTAGEFNEETIERISFYMETRQNLMQKVDSLDARLSGNAVDISPGLHQEIQRTLQKLMNLQSEIDDLLDQKKTRLQEQLGKLNVSRRGIKGYYNQEAAAKPRFIDDKR